MPQRKVKPLCEACGINPAVIKDYVSFYEGTDIETVNRVFSCGVCLHLNGKSVQKLIGSRPEKKRQLLKSWWNPKKRKTTLPKAYPGVDWDKVRCI